MSRKPASPASSSAWIVSTQRELAELFRVPFSTIRRWRDDGLPGEPGSYDLRDVLSWYTDRFQRPTLGDDEERLKRAQADLAEEKLRAIRHETMPVSEHEAYVVALCDTIQRGLLSMVSSLALDVAKKSAREAHPIILARFKSFLWSFAPDGSQDKAENQKPAKASG